MKTAKPAPQVPALARGSWSRALATSLPVLLGQSLIYIYLIKSLGAERVVAAVIGLMLLSPVIVALAHAASQAPLRRPAKANRLLLPKPLRLR